VHRFALLAGILFVGAACPAAGNPPRAEPVSPRLVKTLAHSNDTAWLVSPQFTADGKLLVADSYPGGTLAIWEVPTWREVSTIQTAKPHTIRDLAFAPDSRTLFVPIYADRPLLGVWNGKPGIRRDVKGEIEPWDLLTGRQLAPLAHLPPHAIHVLRLSPDGVRIVAFGHFAAETEEGVDYAATLWDVPTRTPRLLPAARHATAFAFSPDGKMLALNQNTAKPQRGMVKLIDLATGKEKAVLADEQKAQFGVPAFSPDGRHVAATMGWSDTRPFEVRIWELPSGREVGSFGKEGNHVFGHATHRFLIKADLAFSPDGRWLSALPFENKLVLYNLANHKVAWAREVKHSLQLSVPAFTPDGQRVAIVTQHYEEGVPGKGWDEATQDDLAHAHVHLFDVKGASEEVLVTPRGAPGRLAFSPDGKILALGGYGCVWLFDITRPPEKQ
jgi:WD40 repeat protein